MTSITSRFRYSFVFFAIIHSYMAFATPTVSQLALQANSANKPEHQPIEIESYYFEYDISELIKLIDANSQSIELLNQQFDQAYAEYSNDVTSSNQSRKDLLSNTFNKDMIIFCDIHKERLLKLSKSSKKYFAKAQEVFEAIQTKKRLYKAIEHRKSLGE